MQGLTSRFICAQRSTSIALTVFRANVAKVAGLSWTTSSSRQKIQTLHVNRVSLWAASESCHFLIGLSERGKCTLKHGSQSHVQSARDSWTIFRVARGEDTTETLRLAMLQLPINSADLQCTSAPSVFSCRATATRAGHLRTEFEYVKPQS